jgi:hypothetical protein
MRAAVKIPAPAKLDGAPSGFQMIAMGRGHPPRRSISAPPRLRRPD